METEVKRTLERPRHKWEDNIHTDLRERARGVDCSHLAHDRNESPGFIKCREFFEWVCS